MNPLRLPPGVGGLSRRQMLLAAAAACAFPMESDASTGLPALRRGLNLSHWFEYEQSQSVPAEELVAMRQVGFDHVRIPVDPVVFGWRPDAGAARLAFLPSLRQAIETALTAGLEVVLDLHTTAETKSRIEQEPALEQALVSLWHQLGRALADLPPSGLAFELFNEPQYYGWQARRWPALQTRLLAAVREQAPRHLVLLTGNEGGSFKGLQGLPRVSDAAVAYVFHYYEPFLFTHQGAHWLDTRYTTAGLRSNIRYPLSAQEGVSPGLSQFHSRAARELADYRSGQWGAARVRADFDQAGAYARRHGVRLLCNEFGVIRAGVDPASRYRWMTDVRGALEAQGLGWTLWDYSDIFGITDAAPVPPRGSLRKIEPAALQALGLHAAAARR